MTTLTIPARDVQRDDIIPALGGLTVTSIIMPTSATRHEVTLHFNGGHRGGVYLDHDSLVTVERTDPDGALIERMAEAIYLADDAENEPWVDHPDGNREGYRDLARAALAAVRATK